MRFAAWMTPGGKKEGGAWPLPREHAVINHAAA